MRLLQVAMHHSGPALAEPRRRRLRSRRGIETSKAPLDLGNIKDRGFQFDYFSPPHHHGGRAATRIEWQAQTPHESRVLLQVRTAPDERSLEQAEWVGPRGPGSTYDSSGSRLATPAGHGWIQYRAILVSPNGAVSPALEKVSIRYD